MITYNRHNVFISLSIPLEKGENIWDYMTHNSPGKIEDQSNGDVACDSYNKIEEDVRIMKDMGVSFTSNGYVDRLSH